MTLWTRIRRTPAWWIPVVLVVIVCVAILAQVALRGSLETKPSATSTATKPSATATISHSFQSGPPSFAQQLRAGQVEAVVIDDVSGTIDVTTKGPVVEHYRVEYPSLEQLIRLLAEPSGVAITTKDEPWWPYLLVVGLPLLFSATIGGALGYLLGRRRGRKDAAPQAAPASEET